MASTVIGEKREGGFSVRKSGRNIAIETTHHYRVLSDDKNANRATILSTAGLPVVGVTLNGPAVCVSKSGDRDPKNPLYWDVIVTYSTESDEDGTGAMESSAGDPTAWIPIAELGFETKTDVRFADVNGVPWRNSAGAPFDTGIAYSRTLNRYDFDQFEPDTTTLDEITSRNETVNDAVFKGKAAKTLKLSVRGATIGYYWGYRVWRVSYSLVYDPLNWQRKILDHGRWYWPTASRIAGEERLFKVEGANVEGFLNGSGGAAAPMSHWVLVFDQYEERDFATFIRTQVP